MIIGEGDPPCWNDEEVAQVLLSDGHWYTVEKQSFRFGAVGWGHELQEVWYSFDGENGYAYDGPFRHVVSLTYVR